MVRKVEDQIWENVLKIVEDLKSDTDGKPPANAIGFLIGQFLVDVHQIAENGRQVHVQAPVTLDLNKRDTVL